MSTPTSDEPVKSKKPSNSAFKQQRLKAWQPILTAGTVLPMFFGVGIAFIPIGIGLLISSNMVQEYVIDYTDCPSDQANATGANCADIIKDNIKSTCSCTITFNLTESLKGDVYMYYGLKNFYQNHRRYVKSRDDSQLLGIAGPLSGNCDPFAYADPSNLSTPIAPCGAIANSLFNDTIKLMNMNNGNTATEVPVLNTGIAWPTDKNVKFQNPPGSDLASAFNKTYQPINWNKPVYQLDLANPDNNGYQNEDFIVWMRTAALPSFRKLYRRVDHSQSLYKGQLPAGEYQFKINYNYPVTQFGGNKTVVLSTTSWLGGKNPFLGIAYIVVGCICLVLGFVFLVIHIKFGKSTHDMVNITSRTTF